jgi:hypothetical protein
MLARSTFLWAKYQSEWEFDHSPGRNPTQSGEEVPPQDWRVGITQRFEGSST